jgi:hypothetical protein
MPETPDAGLGWFYLYWLKMVPAAKIIQPATIGTTVWDALFWIGTPTITANYAMKNHARFHLVVKRLPYSPGFGR